MERKIDKRVAELPLTFRAGYISHEDLHRALSNELKHEEALFRMKMSQRCSLPRDWYILILISVYSYHHD